jgi:hypothetical protein
VKGNDQYRKQTFNAWDDDVLERCPMLVRESFPYIVTHNLAIDSVVFAKLRSDLLSGKSFDAAAACIEEAHKAEHLRRMAIYYSMIDVGRRGIGLESYGGVKGDEKYKSATPLLVGHPEGLTLEEQKQKLLNPKAFSAFDNEKEYNGFRVKGEYLRAIWVKMCLEKKVFGDMTREDYLHRRFQLIDGCSLAGDASFKFAGKIYVRLPKGGLQRPILALYTVMNEFNQVAFQKPQRTNAFNELKEDVKMMFSVRYAAHGFDPPEVYFTDECCDDRYALPVSMLFAVFSRWDILIISCVRLVVMMAPCCLVLSWVYPEALFCIMRAVGCLQYHHSLTQLIPSLHYSCILPTGTSDLLMRLLLLYTITILLGEKRIKFGQM